jgi:putative transposase
MSATLDEMAKRKPAAEGSAGQQAAAELVRMAKEQGLSLTGPDGLLKLLTKNVIETALAEEMTDHLGYDKHDPAGIGAENIRNGTRAKTVVSGHSGPVEIDVPRDQAGTFEPQIVKKRQRCLGEVDEIVLSLYAKGLTTGEISAHFAEIYGASVSKETVSRITDRVIEEMQAWSSRPLDEIYAAVFIDAIVVKIRDGQVANRPIYAAIGVTLAGERDILGLWAGTGGEGAKFWMAVLTDRRNRGVKDTFFVVCDGLKGLPDVVANTWPQAIVQTSLVHSGGARSGSGCHPHRRERASANRPSRSRCRPVPPVGDGPRTANWSRAVSAITSDGGGLSTRVSQPRRGSSCQNCSPVLIGAAPIIK